MTSSASKPVLAYIGVGSNLERPEEKVLSAIAAIDKLKGIETKHCSSLYRNPPLGPIDQPDFVNAVVEISTSLPAPDLLRKLQQVENEYGRRRNRKWGPRTIDLDILLFGNQEIHTDTLTIPHPEISKRAFVLLPLAEINDHLDVPGQGPVRDLLAALDCSSMVRLGGGTND